MRRCLEMLNDWIRSIESNVGDDGAHRSDAPYLVGNAGRIDPVQGLNARTLFRGNLSPGEKNR
jgi:hypothetical protein